MYMYKKFHITCYAKIHLMLKVDAQSTQKGPCLVRLDEPCRAEGRDVAVY